MFEVKNHREKPLILIIDDDASIRQLLIDVLSDSYACCEAESAEQALAALATDNFDLVISDIRMGGMSGLELVPHVHSRSEEHTSELQSRPHLVCRLLLE